MTSTQRISGSSWRLSARQGDASFEVEDQGCFDELVVDDWFHLERMADNTWWMRVGDARVSVILDGAGKPAVVIERNKY